MSQSTLPSISCHHCGRTFTWKPALAGKKGKCSCGRVVVIPEAPPAPPPPADEELDALYSLAESAPETEPVPPPPVHVSRPAPSLGYATPPPKDHFSNDNLTDNRRDIYIPAALLSAGFIAILVWAFIRYDLPPGLLAIVSLITGVTVAVKTLIIIGLAILFAPGLGVSFGLLRTAVFKFAAILVFTDAALLWLEVIMEATGAIPTSGRYYVRGTATVNLLLAAAIISILTRVLFDMDGEDTGKIAIPMAVLSRLIGFGMKVLVVVILSIMLPSNAPTTPRAAAPTTAPAGAGPDGSSAAASAGATAAKPAPPRDTIRVIETPADREIAQRIAKNPLVRQAQEARNQINQPRGLRELIDRTQVAGAVKMHTDVEGKRLATTKAYIELPAGRAARARCISEAAAVCESYGHKLDTTADTNQRYLVVLFKQ